MKLWRSVKVAGAVLALAIGGNACGRAEAASPAEASVVTVTATEFAFDAPAEIPAGLTTFQLVNRGQVMHHVQIVKLDAGKSVSDFFAALRAGGAPPAWAHEVGGPNAPDPGGRANATLELAPGDYLLLCFVDMPGGVPHVMKGMVKPLKVVPARSARAARPAVDVTMTLDDYRFTLSRPLKPGRQTIRVENGARQPHEVELIRLAPGKTAQDLMAWMGNMQGPPPASAIGGVAGLHGGGWNTFTADLAPGDYVLICFVPDAGDGKPHFMHGMMQTVHVE
jgi:hypothetical protein